MPCIPREDSTPRMRLVFGIAAIALIVHYLYGNELMGMYRKFIDQNVSKIPYHEKENYCKMIAGSSNIDEIIPNQLYIGNLCAAANKISLTSRGIKSILNVAKECTNDFPTSFTYHNIELKDSLLQDIKSYFKEAHNVINFARSTKFPILVHDVTGASRSATIIISYLMQENRLRFSEAFEKVSKIRPMIHPNNAFVEQLLEYEKEIFGEISDKSRKQAQILQQPSEPNEQSL